MGRFNPQDKSYSGPRIPNPEPGVVPARIARIIEIGEHQTKYGVKDMLHIYLSLPTRIIDAEGSEFHGKQHMVRSAPIRKSSNEGASLMKEWINILQPTCSDLITLLNVPCFATIDNNPVQVGSEERIYTNILQISGVPEGVSVGDLDTVPFHFSFTDPDQEIWTDLLWDGIRDKIKSALNYKGSAVEAMVLRLEAEAS